MLVVFPTNHVSLWLIEYVKSLVYSEINCLILLDNPDMESIKKLENHKIPFKAYKSPHEPYLEDFIAEYSTKLPTGWILRLDSDEWISSAKLRLISDSCKTLKRHVAYGLPRSWVKMQYPDTSFQTMHQVNSELGRDHQYRLYHNSYIVPIFRCHTTGIRSENYELLNLQVEILHLLWPLRDWASRGRDQRKYAQFAGKQENLFRTCYVPEEVRNPRWINHEIEDIGEIEMIFNRVYQQEELEL